MPPELIAAMEATAQNPRYHREGSVWAHTQLVASKVEEMGTGLGVDGADLEILRWAAWLHDVGKTITTQWQDGRWRSPGHEKAGVAIARDILLEAGMPAEQRQRILALVRWHGFPLRFESHKWPAAQLHSLGTMTDLRLLGIFSLIDFNGRISDDFEETLSRIQDFRSLHAAKAEYEMGTYAALQEKWRQWPLSFKNAAWNAVQLRQPHLIPKLVEAVPNEEQMKPPFPQRKIILMIGAPLSGKTTWLQRELPTAFHVRLPEYDITDEIVNDSFHLQRKSVELRYHLEINLRNHGTVVVEGTNLHPLVRRKLCEAFREVNAHITWVVVECELKKILERNAALGKPHDEDWLRKRHAQLTLMHPWEAHEFRIVN